MVSWITVLERAGDLPAVRRVAERAEEVCLCSWVRGWVRVLGKSGFDEAEDGRPPLYPCPCPTLLNLPRALVLPFSPFFLSFSSLRTSLAVRLLPRSTTSLASAMAIAFAMTSSTPAFSTCVPDPPPDSRSLLLPIGPPFPSPPPAPPDVTPPKSPSCEARACEMDRVTPRAGVHPRMVATRCDVEGSR